MFHSTSEIIYTSANSAAIGYYKGSKKRPTSSQMCIVCMERNNLFIRHHKFQSPERTVVAIMRVSVCIISQKPYLLLIFESYEYVINQTQTQ